MSALAEALRKKKKALEAASGRRGKTEKIPNGQSKWRLLPSWRGGDDPVFWHDFGQHFIKDEAGDLKAVYVCVSRTYGRECPICDAIDQAHAVTDDAGREIINESKSRLRVLVNALHVDGPEPNTPVILEMPPTVFETVCDYGLNPEYENFIDLEDGLDITFTRSGKGMNTEYSVMMGRKERAVDPSVMDKVANLDDYVAQEFEEQKAKALASLNKTVGMLPGTAGALTHDTTDLDDDVPFERGRTIDSESVEAATETVALDKDVDVTSDTVSVSDEDDLDELLKDFEDA